MLTRRDFLKVSIAASSLEFFQPISLLAANGKDQTVYFGGSGQTPSGNWKAKIRFSPNRWRPGSALIVDALLQMDPFLLSNLTKAGVQIKSLLMLLTAERCFDPDGWLRLPLDDRMSTLLTPACLPIEGGCRDAMSRLSVEQFRNPIDELITLPLKEVKDRNGLQTAHFQIKSSLSHDLPPGIYRLRIDFGVSDDKRQVSLDVREAFAKRARDQKSCSLVYSPPVPCNGIDARGRSIIAKKIQPRIYWVLLSRYNSNGYWGVVADEDAKHFGLSERNLIHDDVILPLFNNEGKKIAYNLEPVPIADTIDIQRNIPWNYSAGELSITIKDPSGKTTNLGKARFRGKNKEKQSLLEPTIGVQGPTTGSHRFTAWTPSSYGRYSVTAKGWMADIWGNRYRAGGTYHFWIAKRMTMATATFQGMAYPVGTSYGRDISFFPSVPAAVTVTVVLYPYSDVSKAKSLSYGGTATLAGVFGRAQGMKPFVLDTPGEYHAHVQATYTDKHGHLWVCSMRHAGIVYPEDSSIIAHGKKIWIDRQFLNKGETHKEGYYSEPKDNTELQHAIFKEGSPHYINIPYNQHDVLLIASEGRGANKVVPVLTYEYKNENVPYDPQFLTPRITNVKIKTSNGMSPHLYPEYITDWVYYYTAAPRPGFSSRFFVGENGTRGPYWPTSMTNFGEQIGASNNGDLPGDIYRLIGGVVVRRSGQRPGYAGYMASAFILPEGSNNNRIIAPGSEDLIGPDGRKSRFFLVSVRPGTVYDQDALFVPFVQIDPVLPAHIRFFLRYPDGTEQVTEGTCDKFGYFVSRKRWRFQQAGVYVFRIEANWNGHKGGVPGLPQDGGFIFVKESTGQNESGLRLALGQDQTFDISSGMKITGFSSSDQVYFTAIMPGAILEQGSIPVINGSFTYTLDPLEINRRIPIYDIENKLNRQKEIGRIIHLTFFSLEKPADSRPFHSFARIILRGTRVLYVS